MAKFKVGDRLRVKDDNVSKPLVRGGVYTIEAFSATASDLVILAGVDHWMGAGCGWSEDRFELAEKRKRKVYIAGPITGIADDNFPAFNAAAAVLKAAGLDVFNPADHGSGGNWAEYMKQDIPELLKCDAVVLLPGWLDSKGAALEESIAFALGMPVYEFEAISEALELLGV